jgi:hypothetical protein
MKGLPEPDDLATGQRYMLLCVTWDWGCWLGMPWPSWQEVLQSCQSRKSHLLLEQVDGGKLTIAEGSLPSQSRSSCQTGHDGEGDLLYLGSPGLA